MQDFRRSTEAQQRAIHACFAISSWDWIPLTELLRAMAADSDGVEASQARAAAIGSCVAAGWLEYDDELDVVRVTANGRMAAGLPVCVFPVFNRVRPKSRK